MDTEQGSGPAITIANDSIAQTMTLTGILSSPVQRRNFLLASSVVLLIFFIATLAIPEYFPKTDRRDILNNYLTSIVASGLFALVASLYLSYFFVDPNDIATETKLLPQDISQALRAMAEYATDYKIFVRTGRHFRAETLPILIKQTQAERRPIRIEVVLLDLREQKVCETYANYRKNASFDRQLWDTRYVQTEILATILKLKNASEQNPGNINIELYLSKRLSSFRIEGSSDEILVTREDPKDIASRYRRGHQDFGAFLTEFGWIKEEAFHVFKERKSDFETLLAAIYQENPEIASLEPAAKKAANSMSPYAR